MPKLVALPNPQDMRADLPRPRGADPVAVLEAVAADARRGLRGVMATVVERHGSAPATPGQRLYLGENGEAIGTVGGGALERDVLTALVEMLGAPEPKHTLREWKLGAELGMCCGGRALLLLEPTPALLPCFLVGAGHVATAVGPMLARLGFAVTVIDARPGWSDETRIPDVRTVQGDYDDLGRDVPTRGVFLAMTHDHALDQRAIEWGLRRGFAFVGGVGSRAKAERTRARLQAKGFSDADVTRVRMPVGADIGARSPEEIAVAIAAELVAFRRGACAGS
jgi:xanthine dehydrogenase accessory factor